ncbi:hypothetical protein CEE45_06905 [Candidatus Heimdallarchaeota archaeon B3_Heim]|nr:MAG: hypothetical protein CEE45_06905 [Candidatus Heimdallarchaeota archaeon B3_Heim]
MTFGDGKMLNSPNSSFYECQFQLNDWILGYYSLNEMISIVTQNLSILQQIHSWKNQGLLFSKPTRSLRHTFVFWVDHSIINAVLAIKSIRGGILVSTIKNKIPDSSIYKGKKANPRPRRVLLDIGCDSPSLIRHLEHLGLEGVRLWDYVADLLHYEIIDLCRAQFIDLLVSTNERLLMPAEEWLTYLMPHRTRLFIVPQDLKTNHKYLAPTIQQKAFQKRCYRVQSKKHSSANKPKKEEACK